MGVKAYSGLLLVLVLLACKARQEYADKPAKSLLNTENDLLEVNEVVFHENDSITSLYLEIKNENLLYKYTDTAQLPYARLRIHYVLWNAEKQSQILDSAHFLVYDRAEEEILSPKSIYSEFKLQVPAGNNYRLSLSIFDLNKKIQYSKNIQLNKQDRYNRQNFLLLLNNSIHFTTVFKCGDTIRVKLNSPLYFSGEVEVFSKPQPIALPPFSAKAQIEQLPEPDSSFAFLIQSGEFTLKLAKTGFYHLRLSPESKKGLSVYVFSSSFPGINDALEMVQSTRYIMTKEEYNACLESDNYKRAIDKFWLDAGGSNERARELLKRYYARVKEANKMFSSYKEGWKTDRGMLFIVFGQPSHIVQKDGEEVWTYGSPVNQTSTTFIFKKVPNPYTGNLFVLDRSVLYKSSWSNAVDLWRQGVYYDGRK